MVMAGQDDRKETLKSLIRRLHEGEDAAKVRAEFKELLRGVPVSEIVEIEEELIAEGIPREKIHLMCDAHIEMFKESLEQAKVSAPKGHPIHTLMEEHKALLDFAARLKKLADAIKSRGGLDGADDDLAELDRIVRHLKDSEKHYLREENALFPVLEKHGITEPPRIMWMDHDRIRDLKKRLYALAEDPASVDFDEFTAGLAELGVGLSELLAAHFFKENNILFPMALQTVADREWEQIGADFAGIGYCCFSPAVELEGAVEPARAALSEGVVEFETGSLSVEELENILNSLPVDITFVDKDDRVRYFSQTKDRIFVRAKSVIGREVRQCHPQKSLHLVNRILDDFKSGRRDAAEFWIELNGRFILIRYFPVRDREGNYLGCLEVTQDITDIRKLEGEKRLLD